MNTFDLSGYGYESDKYDDTNQADRNLVVEVALELFKAEILSNSRQSALFLKPPENCGPPGSEFDEALRQKELFQPTIQSLEKINIIKIYADQIQEALKIEDEKKPPPIEE